MISFVATRVFRVPNLKYQFKIHVNIIRLNLHFLMVRTSGSSHETNENRRTSISSVVDRRRRHELFVDGRSQPGGAPSKSHLRAWLPVATRCFLSSLTICPRTTCVVYLQVASRTSAMRITHGECAIVRM